MKEFILLRQFLRKVKMNKDILLINIHKIHTTELGKIRIAKNLKIDEDPVDFCKRIIMDKKCIVNKRGKNYYCEKDNIVLTINSYSYTIITAHKQYD